MTSPVIRIAELEIDPVHLDRYKALLAEEIEASVVAEPGVLFLHAASLTGSANLIRILEGYADQAAYEAHLQAPHFLKYKMKTASMILSLRLLPADVVALHAKDAVRLP
ncbi:MAG TPA: putative quinol monooxygenase [Devosia sp.]|nr:putative quinol monooxygenase [Devosia sp.]